MTQFAVGQVVPQFIGMNDSNAITFKGGSPTLIQFMDKPSPAEIKAAQSCGTAEFRFNIFGKLLVLTFKLEGQPWQEAIYNPTLDEDVELPVIDAGSGLGLALMLMQVNSANGKITALRLIGLGERFSRELIGATKLLMDSPISQMDYGMMTAQLQMKYSTTELVDMCKNYFKLR